jgi:hypothetical protein
MTGQLLGGGGAGAGISKGTAFPGSPADGDVFLRTDIDLLFEWDAAASVWQPLGGSLRQAILAMAPSSYWPLDEVSGSYVDLGSGGISGTHLQGSRAEKTIRGSRGVENSLQGLATFGNNYSFAGNLPYTVFFVLKRTATSVSSIAVSKSNIAGTQGWDIEFSSTNFLTSFRAGGSAAASTQAMDDTTDYHGCMAAYDGTNNIVNLDGLEVSVASAAALTASANTLTLGASAEDPTQFFAKGRYSHLAIWSRCLNAAERQILMQRV